MPFSETASRIEEFSSFEAREAAFNRAVGHLIPARYLGPQQFWTEFRRITETEHDQGDRKPAFITSNPRDCLAFGTVEQVLTAAQWTSTVEKLPANDIDHILKEFGLKAARNQPLRTLSGGETVRLSLAKALLAAYRVSNLVISSPFCWLSRNHLPLLEKVLETYKSIQKPVDLLIMQGESRQDRLADDVWQNMASESQDFSLQMEKLRIHLGTPINAITAPLARARVVDFSSRLTSPCLVMGDNGQGKSLLAKVLCGAIASDGALRIESRNGRGRGRLLFQDVVTQTLLRSTRQLARSGDWFSGSIRVHEVFDALWEMQQNAAFAVDAKAVEAVSGSLLEVKTMLIAVRLAQQPAVLILDEPDWGLTRTEAIGLVVAVIIEAHRLGVPVMLISHKPWWHSLAGSMVQVSKAAAADPEILFEIKMQVV